MLRSPELPSYKMDCPYTVTWAPGMIMVHASSKQEAKAIVLQWMEANDVLQASTEGEVKEMSN